MCVAKNKIASCAKLALIFMEFRRGEIRGTLPGLSLRFVLLPIAVAYGVTILYARIGIYACPIAAFPFIYDI